MSRSRAVAYVTCSLVTSRAQSSLPKYTPAARPSDAKNDAAFGDNVISLLQEAQRPVALIGAGAKLSGAIIELRQLLDDLNIPTFATVHGLGAVEPAAPYYLGMVGMHGTRAANMALHENDLLLVFGARLDDRVTGDPTRFAPNAKIVDRKSTRLNS